MATETLRPNAAGDETNLYYNAGQGQKSPNPIKNYTCVDEETPDEHATTVNCGPGQDAFDLYNLLAHSGSGTINSAKVYIRCCQSGNNSPIAQVKIKTYATVYSGDEESPSAHPTYTTYSKTWAQNPNTSAAWTWDEIDAMQIGVRCKGGFATGTYCTQVYVEIDYATGPTPNAYNKIFYTSEPPTPNAWNQVKREAGTGWRKLEYS